ncbi:MAG: thioredoxin family protein [Lachnospiraceae bacterium]|nr:thioredoxin family protein [Lachnospiraceae bacterium]
MAIVAKEKNLEKDQKIAELEKSYPAIYDVLNSVTYEKFNELIQENREVYVYIGRPSCGDCQEFEPELIQIIQQYEKNQQIVYFNVHSIRQDDKEWETFKEKYNVQYTPTIAKFKQGKLIDKVEWTPEEGISIEDVKSWILKYVV